MNTQLVSATPAIGALAYFAMPASQQSYINTKAPSPLEQTRGLTERMRQMTPSKKPQKRRRRTKRPVLCPRCGMSPLIETWDGLGCPVCGHNTWEHAEDSRGSVSYDPAVHPPQAKIVHVTRRI